MTFLIVIYLSIKLCIFCLTAKNIQFKFYAGILRNPKQYDIYSIYQASQKDMRRKHVHRTNINMLKLFASSFIEAAENL